MATDTTKDMSSTKASTSGTQVLTTECLVYLMSDGRWGITPTAHVKLWCNDVGLNIDNSAKEYVPYGRCIIMPSMVEALAFVKAEIAKANPKEKSLGT